MAAILKQVLVLFMISLFFALLFLYTKRKLEWVTDVCQLEDESRKAESWFKKMWSWLSTVISNIKTGNSSKIVDSLDTHSLLTISCQSSLTENILHVFYSHILADITFVVLQMYDSVYITLYTYVYPYVHVVLCLIIIVFIIIICFFVLNKWRYSLVNCNHVEQTDAKHNNQIIIGKSLDEKYMEDSLLTYNGNRKDLLQCSPRQARSLWTSGTFLLLLLLCVSIPWEFVRLYQAEISKRASKVSAGVPEYCTPGEQSLFRMLKSWLSHQVAWSHNNLCDQYFYAQFVDPIWEISPLMVVTSLVTRCLVHPAELLFASAGRSLRNFFTEIPVQWQPVLMLTILAMTVVTLLMTCSYRLSVPWLLRIEPRTPVAGQREQHNGSAQVTIAPQKRQLKWRETESSQAAIGQDDRRVKSRDFSSTPHSSRWTSATAYNRNTLFQAGSKARSGVTTEETRVAGQWKSQSGSSPGEEYSADTGACLQNMPCTKKSACKSLKRREGRCAEVKVRRRRLAKTE